MCPACTAERDRWLDALPVLMRQPVRIHTIGDKPRDVTDARHLNFRRVRDLVNHQRDRIRERCLTEHTPSR